MTVGISKTYLCNSLKSVNAAPIDETAKKAFSILLDRLVADCVELNPWLPIDENTPKEKNLLLFYPKRENGDDFDMPSLKIVGYWSFPRSIWVCDYSDTWGEEKTRLAQPTHYQELPDDPDTGAQPYVMFDGIRMAVSQKIMQELELKNGQTINLLIHIHIIQLALAENIASMAIKKAMEQSKDP